MISGRLSCHKVRSMADKVSAQSGLNPTDGIDILRLEAEMENYQQWMDERTDDAYRIAEIARSKNLDYKPFVEIPRAADLAGRT